ncbi:hypothetical protein K458DRAFT_479748 [Lentithecium fluviatile CBS 122367]|uniref:Galactose oxidase n=1 Tax=Lentithecium fluviatile CBS 122367 TaxID=1168545 RepID=A0A6G1IQQ2_9PLEO|nr:hypothetical protein K458DRAFT_479748 [Lentithecium fluviatile CBS 122367]
MELVSTNPGSTMMLRFIALLVLASISTAQKDPLKDFCRLHSHQTTIVDRRLYIDGGLVNWSPLSADSLNYTSTWLRYGNLDEDHEGFPQQYTLAKNNSVPSVHGGVLWSDATNKVVYMYGGEYGNDKPEDFRLWFYDIVYDTWNVSNASTTDIRRASWGAGVAVQDKGRGYYYGGWLTNSSVPGYHSRTPLKNMLVYDIVANSFRNQTGPDDTPRAEGVMIYLPVGDGGFLVYFGGIQFPYGNDTVAALPMDEIYLYDIANDVWYKQTASGDEIPGDRRRFCAGAAWADDRSSYNIYLYGGASVGNGTGYGDVWILSLPSFTWIKFYPTEEDGFGDPFPHHSLTCDVIENSQMIVMGGTFPNHTTECDVADVYAQHGLDLGKANTEGAKWAKFNPNVTQYRVPTEIARSIGGEATGGATVLAPTGGWAHRDLQGEFQRHYTPTTRTPTRYIPTSTTTTAPTTSPTSIGSKSNKKTIIASAVGGGVGALLLVALVAGICLCLRRRRRNQTQGSTELPAPHTYPNSSANINASPVSQQQSSFISPSVTQYTFTPQGSPPPPTDGTWSHQFDKEGRTTSQYFSQGVPGSQSPPSRASPVAQYGYDRSRGSPVEIADARPTPFQEMPNVRSPLGFAPIPEQPQPPDIVGIDPYFSQHPPRGAGT